MTKLRVKFKKDKEMVFISHLDLMRLFQRIFRRINLPIKYSEGYNPHQKFAFATALAVGVASYGEYMDIELEEEIDIKAFVKEMNSILPKGIEILKASYHEGKASLMSQVSWSDYAIMIKLESAYTEEELNEKLKEVLDRDEILITKIKKKRNRRVKREVNVRDLIKDISLLTFEGDKVIIKTTLKTGSRGNLNPNVIVESLIDLTGLEVDTDSTRIQRLELFIEDEERVITPL